MKEAVIALGTNLFDREENLKNAMNSLKNLPDILIKKVSSVYETKPFQTPDKQDDYLNCCIKIETSLSPEMLLGACLGIESAMGRVRTFNNASRIIDIDIILYQGISVCTPNLILPHPGIKQRAFVMVPLSDLYESKVALGLDFSQALKQADLSEILLYKKDFKFF